MKKHFDEQMKIDPLPIHGSMSLSEMVDKTFLAYNSGRIREACQLFDSKICREGVLTGIGLAGALTPAGLGISCIIPLIKNGLIDWIVSTGAVLYHDLHFSLDKSLYRGSPNVDDRRLKKDGVIRIYDVLFEYEVLLSTDVFIRTVLSSKEFQKEMGTAEIHNLLGKFAAEREKKLGLADRSILSVAYEHDVPIYTSSPGDSSIGMNISALALNNNRLRIDTLRDVNETAALVYSAKKNGHRSAVVVFGGGSPKNFILQTEPHIQEILGLSEAGHDYFIQVTDARPDTGGLSGATPDEAVSWGKIDPAALPDTVVVYADTTIVLPILTSYVISKNRTRDHKRLFRKRDEKMLSMIRDFKHSASGLRHASKKD